MTLFQVLERNRSRMAMDGGQRIERGIVRINGTRIDADKT
jgi:hypothetical protein